MLTAVFIVIASVSFVTTLITILTIMLQSKVG